MIGRDFRDDFDDQGIWARVTGMIPAVTIIGLMSDPARPLFRQVY